MAITLSAAAASAAADALCALLNGGHVRLYDGARPVTADTAITTQVLLASPTFANPAFAAAVSGVASAHAVTSGTNASADAVTALLNGGTIRIYTAPQPATADTAITTQTLLASPTFGSPAFAAAVAGVSTANAITADPSASASGTANWARFVTSG